MKRLTALISALLLVSGLCSCGQTDISEDAESSAKTSVSEEKVVSETEAVSEDEEPEASENDFVGKWEVVKIVLDGEDVTKSFAPDFPACMYGQLEVNEKGLARMYTLSPYGEETEEEYTKYKWEMKDDETAVFHDPDLADDMTAYIEDGCLVFSPDGMQLYLERVDEFHTLEKDDIDNETKQKFVGKWELAKFIPDGEDMTEMLSQDLPVYAYLQLEIHENGNGTMKMSRLVNGEIEEKTENFEWKMKDAATAVLHMTDEEVEDSELFFRYGELVMRDRNSKDNDAYFKKVEEFHSVENLTIEIPDENEG